MPRKNKFDPPAEPEKFEPERCEKKLNDTAEEFLVFCRRALGTNETAPLVVAGEPLNGASIGNLAEAFAICYGLGKQAAKTAPAPEDPMAARRKALEESNDREVDANGVRVMGASQ